ncbi:hypothetical protein HDV02_000337 [Globomyces sp. JEL0801]|nr:hypothetical protein HDV02_000337 [Globomyces sp. JEL0801]
MVIWDPLSESFLNAYEMRSLIAIGGRGSVVKVWNKRTNKFEIDANWDTGSAELSPYLHRNFPKAGSAIDTPTDKLDVLLQENSKLNVSTIDLFDFISTYHPLNETIIRHIFLQMMTGVQYMHDKGMIHRDLKDENIVIDSNLNSKLIDFDVASFTKPGESFQGVVGSIQYTTPESLKVGWYEGKPADIWSLGVTLFVMCKNRLPFRNSLEIVQTVDLSTLESETIKDLCLAMLNLDPRKRPTVQEVLNHPWLVRK